MLASATVRVLVVDDFEPFRRILSSMVGEKEGLRIVGQAADGLEAVRLAEILSPDLILLDIALPGLNGIEVARRIRKAARGCKILFVTQNSSPALAREALRLGAGYILKTDTTAEFLPAIEAVLSGKKFISHSLAANVYPATG
jgi:DNA-binding NarL/FixJ family response regulator